MTDREKRLVEEWLKINKPSVIQHPPFPVEQGKMKLGESSVVST